MTEKKRDGTYWVCSPKQRCSCGACRSERIQRGKERGNDNDDDSDDEIDDDSDDEIDDDYGRVEKTAEWCWWDHP